MNVLYFTKSGRMKREKVKSNIQFYEGPDGGFYCCQPESALRDRKHKLDATILVFQDCPTPLGGATTIDYFDTILLEVHETLSEQKKVRGISFVWVRDVTELFAKLGHFLVKYGIALGLAALVAWAMFGEKIFGA